MIYSILNYTLFKTLIKLPWIEGLPAQISFLNPLFSDISKSVQKPPASFISKIPAKS